MSRFVFIAGAFFAMLPCADGAPSTSEFALVSGRVQVTTPSWGPDCGEKPQSNRDKTGTIYDLRGGQFMRRGKARLLDQPGVCRSATGLPTILETQEEHGFRCSSPKKKGTQAFGRVSRKLTRDTATITHAFEYNWRLHGSQCQVEQKGKWVLRRSSPKNVGSKKDVCTTPGRAVTVSTSMATLLNVKPTSATRLKATALDANGCVTDTKIKWRTNHGRITSGARLRLKKVPAETLVTVTGTAGSGALTLKFKVSDTRNLGGLAPAYAAYSSNAPIQETVESREQVHIAVTVNSQKGDRSSTPWLPLLGSFLALCLGAACLWLAGRLRPRQRGDAIDDSV